MFFRDSSVLCLRKLDFVVELSKLSANYCEWTLNSFNLVGHFRKLLLCPDVLIYCNAIELIIKVAHALLLSLLYVPSFRPSSPVLQEKLPPRSSFTG